MLEANGVSAIEDDDEWQRPPKVIPLPLLPLNARSQLSVASKRNENASESIKSNTRPGQSDYGPQAKKRKLEANELLDSLKCMDSDEQLELWKKMINNHPFDLNQLRSLLTAIDSLIKVDIVSAVPYEIALYIMSFLSPEDLCRAAQVCRSWRTVCEDNHLWREKCNEEGLLSDELTMDVIFRRRIKRSHHVQEEFVKKINSAVPRSEFKSAFLNHINILRNWRTRNLDGPNKNCNQQQAHQERSRTSQQRPESNHNSSQDRNCQQNSENSSRGGNVPPTRSNQTVSNDNNPTENNNEYNTFAKRHKIRLRCHEDFVITCLQYNPKSELIVSGSDDQTLKVWSSETGQCLVTLEGHSGGVWSSALTENDIVISGATDRTVRVWDGRTGEWLHTLFGHTSTVRCLAVDGDYVVSGSRDATLRLWKLAGGTCEHVFLGHNAAVRCVEFRDGIIVSGAYDHLVMVWDAKTGNCMHTLAGHISRIYSLQFDGKTIASGSLDSTICIWDAEKGKLKHLLEGHQSLTSKMQLKGNLLVSANADSYCKIWDIKTGKCLRTLGENQANKHSSAITSVYFNDRHVVTSSDDGTVKLWDFRTGECIRNLVTLPTAANGGVIWRIRASYTKLICGVGSRMQTEDTHLLILDFDD